METRYLRLDDYIATGEISEEDLLKIREAAAVLQKGGLVAFPTETVYGLGGDARRADVSERIYAAKGRPSDNPLIVHISKIDELPYYVREIPESGRKLSEAFWPGPMTLVFQKSEIIPERTTGGLATVAVRMPVHKVARKLIELSGLPVAAPSANRSGRPSTTTAAHCLEDLNGRVDMILDGGPCDIGVESTIIDVTGEKPAVLRPGAVTVEMITELFGEEPLLDKAVTGPLSEGEKPKAPGMKYRHYAPRAPLTVVRSADGFSETAVWEKILELASAENGSGKMTEILCSSECEAWIRHRLAPGVRIRSLGEKKREEEVAKNLFSVLRDTDSDGDVTLIAEGFGEKDLFLAVMNRLKKAAGWNIIEV